MANYAYVTLITRASYLAGVVILAESLRQQQSPYPLIVCYTTALPEDCLTALEHESHQSNLLLHAVEELRPTAFSTDDLIAERFGDTWTKLRVFEPWQPKDFPVFERLCYLDADMMLCRNPDSIFDTPLPGPDWLAASHACVCNPDKDEWAPASWTPANCAHSRTTCYSKPTPVPNTGHAKYCLSQAQIETYAYLNSGLFLFQPSLSLWKTLYSTFKSMSLKSLKAYKLPDQDFINEFFYGRWLSVGWQYNALKTMRYRHSDLWKDEAIINVHYIVDKPWAGCRPTRKQACNGVAGDDDHVNGIIWSAAGFQGLDGETHSWWWKTWDHWRSKREKEHQRIVDIVERQMYGGASSGSSDMQAIGAQVQAFAANGRRSNSRKSEELNGCRSDRWHDQNGSFN